MIYTWNEGREHPLFSDLFSLGFKLNRKTVDKTRNIISPLGNIEEREVKLLNQQCQLPCSIACTLISFIS